MTGLVSLWLPMVLSAVAVFVASSIIHMVLPWHKGDYRVLPDEDRIQDALRPFSIPPGDYLVPRPKGPDDLKTPEFQEKMRKGPVFLVTVWPNGPMSMASNLTQWFLFGLVVSLFSAYLTGRALPPAADSMQVFRFASTVGFLGYALALAEMSIWYKRAWSLTLKATFDGLIYGCLTGAVFAWLWPR